MVDGLLVLFVVCGLILCLWVIVVLWIAVLVICDCCLLIVLILWFCCFIGIVLMIAISSFDCICSLVGCLVGAVYVISG